MGRIAAADARREVAAQGWGIEESVQRDLHSSYGDSPQKLRSNPDGTWRQKSDGKGRSRILGDAVQRFDFLDAIHVMHVYRRNVDAKYACLHMIIIFAYDAWDPPPPKVQMHPGKGERKEIRKGSGLRESPCSACGGTTRVALARAGRGGISARPRYHSFAAPLGSLVHITCKEECAIGQWRLE